MNAIRLVFIGAGSMLFGPLPEGIANLLPMQANVQRLAVEAAVKILDELWEMNRPYIKTCV